MTSIQCFCIKEFAVSQVFYVYLRCILMYILMYIYLCILILIYTYVYTYVYLSILSILRGEHALFFLYSVLTLC
jgi:hypothetical protein